MTATETNKNVPELRFPEFKGEWEKKSIKEIGKFIGGGTPESTKTNYWQGEIPWVSSSDIKENNIHDIDITRFITDEAIKNSATKIVPENSLLIVSRVGIGKFAVAKQKLCTSQDFTSLIAISDNTYFLAYYFCSRKNRFLSLSQGTSIKGFTGQDIGNLKFHVPSLPEQQKIATFLTAVDKRIHLLTQKKEKLEYYKKGVMQKLFSRELRFKPALSEVEGDENGNDYPEWEEKSLGEVFEFIGTNSLSRSMLNYESGKIKNIHYGDIHTKFKSLFDTSKEDVPFINNEVDNSKFSNNQYCKEGDLVIADASEDYKDIGKSIEIINTNNCPLVSGLHTILARPKRKSPLGFNAYLMQSSSVRKQLMRLASGISVLGISKNNLSSILLQLPCFKEQQKIASFLSAIDKQIEQVARQIEHSNQWKKGLLQQMFV